MLKEERLNYPKSLQNSSLINLDEVNKAIELTRFNVSFYIKIKLNTNYRKLMQKMLLILMLDLLNQ